MLLRVIPVLLDDIADAAKEVPKLAQRLSAGRPTDLDHPRPPVTEQLISRLDIAAAPYPRNLCPSVLAGALKVRAATDQSSVRVPEDEEAPSGGKSLEAVLRKHRRVVVLGGPGSGKSTLLVGEVLRRVRRGEVAMMVRLPDLARATAATDVPADLPTATEILVDVVSRELGVAVANDPARFAHALAQDPGALLALDGLDEVEPADVARLQGLLTVLVGLPGSIVVSSRPLGYVAPPQATWHEVAMSRLSRRYARDFMDSWFKDRPARQRKRARRALERSDLRILSATPVLLGIVATVAAQGPVPRSRGALYDTYLSVLLQRTWRPAAEHRTNVEDIDARRRAASDLAWCGATGGTLTPDEGPWQETITLRGIVRARATANLTVAQDLVENDAVLAPYGRHASRDYQRYIWSHRTLHEHLVGSHLFAEYFDRQSVWREHIERLVLGPDRWIEPLCHMLQLFDDAAQMDFLDELRVLSREAGESGWFISNLAFELARSFRKNCEARKAAARWAAESASWHQVRQLDLDLWRAEWPAALARGEDAILHGSIDGLTTADAAWLATVIKQYRASPVMTAQQYLLLLDKLGDFDPDNALVLYVDELEMGIEGSPEFDKWARQPSTQTLQSAVRRGLGLGAYDRLRLLQGLSYWGDALVTAGVDDLIDPVELRAAAMFEGIMNARGFGAIDADARAAFELLLSGEYGPLPAYMVASRADLDHIDIDYSQPYARLGRATTEIFDFRLGAETLDVTDAVALLLTVDEASIRDPQRAYAFLRAAAMCMRAAPQVPSDEAFALYRHLLRLRNNDHALIRPSSVARDVIHDLCTIAETIVISAPFAETVKRILDSPPDEWPISVWDVHRTPDISELIEVRDSRGKPQLSVPELVDLVVWAARADSSALAALSHWPQFEDAAESIADQIWQRCPAAISLPGNAHWIWHTLREKGRLYAWRQRHEPSRG